MTTGQAKPHRSVNRLIRKFHFGRKPTQVCDQPANSASSSNQGGSSAISTLIDAGVPALADKVPAEAQPDADTLCTTPVDETGADDTLTQECTTGIRSEKSGYVLRGRSSGSTQKNLQSTESEVVGYLVTSPSPLLRRLAELAVACTNDTKWFWLYRPSPARLKRKLAEVMTGQRYRPKLEFVLATVGLAASLIAAMLMFGQAYLDSSGDAPRIELETQFGFTRRMVSEGQIGTADQMLTLIKTYNQKAEFLIRGAVELEQLILLKEHGTALPNRLSPSMDFEKEFLRVAATLQVDADEVLRGGRQLSAPRSLTSEKREQWNELVGRLFGYLGDVYLESQKRNLATTAYACSKQLRKANYDSVNLTALMISKDVNATKKRVRDSIQYCRALQNELRILPAASRKQNYKIIDDAYTEAIFFCGRLDEPTMVPLNSDLRYEYQWFLLDPKDRCGYLWYLKDTKDPSLQTKLDQIATLLPDGAIAARELNVCLIGRWAFDHANSLTPTPSKKIALKGINPPEPPVDPPHVLQFCKQLLAEDYLDPAYITMLIALCKESAAANPVDVTLSRDALKEALLSIKAAPLRQTSQTLLNSIWPLPKTEPDAKE